MSDPTPTHDDDRPTLTVRVGEQRATETKAAFGDRLEQLEADDDPAAADVDEMHVLVLEDHDAVEQLFRATNIELLRAMSDREPESIRELADAVGRSHTNVLRNLGELETLGLVEFEDAGRAKRPRARYSELDIEVSLTGSDGPVSRSEESPV